MGETIDANKVKFGSKEALELTKKASRMVAAKGKKIESFDLGKGRPDDDTLIAHLIGPTGNLRAPTMLVGKTLVVGFNEEAYRDVLGA